ncbi:hypothetical protein [Papillibacter cinnamivorans]|uniref:hypothetical protein n=1 Tax=Papillibacter cinnamivorans TaxID=100176 RepID=UPI0011815E4B|nr:hypothetical protein [Papillibacter cinnamivorans]
MVCGKMIFATRFRNNYRNYPTKTRYHSSVAVKNTKPPYLKTRRLRIQFIVIENILAYAELCPVRIFAAVSPSIATATGETAGFLGLLLRLFHRLGCAAGEAAAAAAAGEAAGLLGLLLRFFFLLALVFTDDIIILINGSAGNVFFDFLSVVHFYFPHIPRHPWPVLHYMPPLFSG